MKNRTFVNEILIRGVPCRFSKNFRFILGLLAIGQFVGILLVTERAARAYVDPGSGLLTLQMLTASIVGGLYFLRHKLRKLVAGKRGPMTRVEEPASSRESTNQEQATSQFGK